MVCHAAINNLELLKEEEKWYGNISKKELSMLEIYEKMSSQDKVKSTCFSLRNCKKERTDKASRCLKWIVLAE